MAFDIEGARKSGASDSTIAEYLAKLHDYDLASARMEFKDDTYIADYLATLDAQTQFTRGTEVIPEWGKESPNLYGAFGAGKAVYEQFAKPAVEAVGMGAGALAGAAAGGPAGSVAGAGLLYGGVKTATEYVGEQLDALNGVYRTPPKTVPQQMQKAAENVVEGAAFQAGGDVAPRIVVGTVNKLVAPFHKKMTPMNRLMRDQAAERGITFSPTDVTQSRTLALGESMMQKSISAADIMKDFNLQKQLEPLMKIRTQMINEGASSGSIDEIGVRIRSEVTDYLQAQTDLKGEALNTMRRNVLAMLGTGASFKSVGMTALEGLKTKSIAAHARAQAVYREVGDDLSQGISAEIYEPTELRKVAKEILQRKSKLAGQDSTMMGHLKWGAKEVPADVQAEIANLPQALQEEILSQYGVKKMSWNTLQDFHAEMNALMQAENLSLGTKVPGMRFQTTPKGHVYGDLRAAVRKDMEAIARAEGGTAWEKFNAANTIYGEYAQVYKHKFIRQLMKANPEDLIEVGFKPNGLTELDLMREALGPNEFLRLRGLFTNKLFGVGKHDVFDPKFLKSQISRYGDEYINALYGNNTTKMFKSIAEEGLRLDKQTPGAALLKRLSISFDDTVVDSLIGAPETKLSSKVLLNNIETIKRVVSRDTFDSLGNKLLGKIFAKDQLTGIIKPTTFAKMVDKYDRILMKFYHPKKVAELRQLANISRRLTTAEQIAGNPSGTGQTVMTFGTFGMLISNLKKGISLTVGPAMLAKVYLSKSGMKWLTEGFRIKANTEKGIALATKLIAIMGTQSETETLGPSQTQINLEQEMQH